MNYRSLHIFRCLALLAVIFMTAIRPNLAETIDTVLVTGVGYNEESATGYCIENAVTSVMGRYVREKALKAKEEQIRYRVLDQSERYLTSLEILSIHTQDDGTVEITSEVQVSVDKLLTSLRNLDVEVLMWAPGPDQAIEGRRGAGSKTKPDRFNAKNVDSLDDMGEEPR